MKIDKRKNYYMVLDTETANGLDQPLVYDLGFAIIDKKGNVLHSDSLVIYDIYRLERAMMESSYYAKKLPMYEEQIARGERRMVNFSTARNLIHEACKLYNVKAIMAHNAPFDYRATSTTQRYLTKSKYRYFLPYGIPIWDTKKMAQDTIAKQKAYIRFCEQDERFMFRGKPRVSAEILYKYISGNVDFEEEHTGLADVLIEKEIFVRCIRQHKKMRREAFAKKVLPYKEYEDRGWELTPELCQQGTGKSLLDELTRLGALMD